jgi:hypothetical protein
MALHTTRSNDRGVSEAIGFMLIFGIVIAGIGLVTLYGYPLLLQQQVSADEKIMEKNMIVLQNDIKSLAYKTVPFKETSLKIGGGSLTVYNSSYSAPSSAIEINDFNDTPYIPHFTPGELRYESVSAQTDISIQNGAVVMRPRVQQGSTMIAEPRWFFDEPTNTMVINLINITSTNIMAKEGIGTVQMSLVGEPYYNVSPPIPPGKVIKLVYFTPDAATGGQDYSVAWDNYIMKTFDNPPYITITKTGTYPGPYTYTMTNGGVTPMTLIIKKFEVEIRSI